MTVKVAVIGLGKQSMEDHIPAILTSSEHKLIAVVDSNKDALDKASNVLNVPGFSSVQDMLDNTSPYMAVVAVPHDSYLEVIKGLSGNGVHIIKEKPFAVNSEEASEVYKIIKENDTFLGVTLQRRFNPIFQSFNQLKNNIGKIYSVEGRYTMNISRLDEGWRASKARSVGGALIDMGYHYIDLLLWYMGMPKSITARMTRGNRLEQDYDVEDTINLLFDYTSEDEPEEKIIGNILISRNYPQKQEILTVYGTEGIIEVQRGKIRRLTRDGEEIESLQRNGGWPSAATEQLAFFTKAMQKIPGYEYDLKEHFKHVAIIDAAYESDKKQNSVCPQDFLIK